MADSVGSLSSFKFYKDQSRRRFLYKMSLDRWSSMQELQNQEDGFQSKLQVQLLFNMIE